jgi:hypothetical protein
MLVPENEKTIETFKELILSGFKIAYMSYNSLATGMNWYKRNFIRSGVMHRWNSTFFSLSFDEQILYKTVVEMRGKLAIFREDIDTQVALHMIQEQVWKQGNKSSLLKVSCHQVAEPLLTQIGMVSYTSIFFFHMASYFSESVGLIVEAGILNELTNFNIWQRTKLPKKPWLKNDKNIFVPSGLNAESKIPIIFIAFGVGLGGSTIIYCIEIIVYCVSVCLKSKNSKDYSKIGQINKAFGHSFLLNRTQVFIIHHKNISAIQTSKEAKYKLLLKLLNECKYKKFYFYKQNLYKLKCLMSSWVTKQCL